VDDNAMKTIAVLLAMLATLVLAGTTMIANDNGSILFISLKELGIRLGLSETEMRNLHAAGKIRTIPYGRRRLVPIAEVTRLAAALEAGELSPIRNV
jgi:hypothetical protein